MSTVNERQYWIALAHCTAMTVTCWKKLLTVFGSAEAIWKADEAALARADMGKEGLRDLLALRRTRSPETIEEELARHKLHAITLHDEAYPKILKEIVDPPYVLFIEGELPAIEPVGALGVVGTRTLSSYGKAVLPPLIEGCVQNGMTIVSGLALGIDGIAHETTVQNGGRTIAVIGSGIDRQNIYPPQHRQLADRIVASGGAIVSEYPPGTRPETYHFPARNRIIAGLSLGVLVCEAPQKSGALITAYAALDQNREIFAVPGPINHPNAWGPNDLIKRGAIPVTTAEDILNVLPIAPISAPIPLKKNEAQDTAALSPLEHAILLVVQEGEAHVDTIVTKTNLTAAEIASTLVLMEMQGKVRNVGGMRYTLS